MVMYQVRQYMLVNNSLLSLNMLLFKYVQKCCIYLCVLYACVCVCVCRERER